MIKNNSIFIPKENQQIENSHFSEVSQINELKSKTTSLWQKLQEENLESDSSEKPYFISRNQKENNNSSTEENFTLKRPRQYLDCNNPRKKTRTELSRASESIFKTLYAKAEKSKLQVNGIEARLARFSKGSFVRVYRLAADQPIVAGINNDELLIKLFHGKKTKFGEKALNAYMETALSNYKNAQELKLPCAKIYNFETALNDDKFYLVEKISHEIQWQNKEQIAQVCAIFKIVFSHCYSGDLSFDNLRVTEAGKVVIVDFSEKNINFDDEYKISNFVMQMIKKWCKEIQKTHKLDAGREAAQSLLNQFAAAVPNEKHFQKIWIDDVLEKYFGNLLSLK